MRNGKRQNAEWKSIEQMTEFGSRTRRRPIGRDYAAAKDAEGGMEEDRMRKSECGIPELNQVQLNQLNKRNEPNKLGPPVTSDQ